MTIEKRKMDHIDVCLGQDVRSETSNGFEFWRLVHNALPEANFDDYSIRTVFLKKYISAPFMISSMTGGTEMSEKINRNLLEAAASLNIAFAIGSQRIYLEKFAEFQIPVRKIAPDIPVLANVGAVQLNYGFTRDHMLRAVDMLEADALILHLNPLQELMQKNGNTDFSGLLDKIGKLCADFPVPVVVKEVGWGIHPELAKTLWNAGVSVIDVAGAGGTSWSKVETFADRSESAAKFAEPFNDWGIPTADCIASIHTAFPEIPLIASGGITDGVEAAKAVMLGAGICGMAAALLPAAAMTAKDVCRELERVIAQYKIARFLSCGIEKKDRSIRKHEAENH